MYTEPEFFVQTRISPKECLKLSEKFAEIRRQIAQRASDKGHQLDNIDRSDCVLQNAMWADIHALWREYRIVSAWSDMYYALYTFMTEGSSSDYMTEYVSVAGRF